MSIKQFSVFATAAKGLEDLLKNELDSLGLSDVKQQKGGVAFTANLQQILESCLWSRIANRILLPISEFTAESEDQLYAAIQDIDWQRYFDCGNSFAVDCSLQNSNITHNQYAALKTKDAIVDQFRQNTGERPSVETEQPDVRLNLYINRNKAIISLDLSGDSLHKRGYRQVGEHAPLKENLAAAILMRSQWPKHAKQQAAFVDPMCGSGTLVIEAALMAADIAPGIQRDYFGFFHWSEFDKTSWDSVLEDAENRKQQGLQSLPSITGYDASHHAVRAAITNAKAAGLEGLIHFEKRDISQATPRKQDDKGIIVVNPPYGERLSTKPEVAVLYHQMGEQFKTEFLGWQASVFTDSLDLGKKIPLRAKKIHSLYNGAIECKLLHFDVDPKSFFDSNRKFRVIPAQYRSENANMFENRLKKNDKHLARWAKRESISCYRVYDADLPEYALAVDLYFSDKLHVLVQEYEAPKSIDQKVAEQRFNEALSIIVEYFAISHAQIHIRQRKQQKGKQQYEKLEQEAHYHIVEEAGHKFYVDFDTYLDSGLFLDHRITRGLIQQLAKDKSFLNLFCYTASFSVFAIKGGALSSTSVDMSNTYLDWAKKNYELNEIFEPQHQLVRADCMAWLEMHNKKYDLIFLDPPSFSNSKKMQENFAIQRDHVDLIKKTLRLLSDDGILIFSNNLRSFKLEESAFPDYQFENISMKTIPEDFKRNKKIHHCWKISRKATL